VETIVGHTFTGPVTSQCNLNLGRAVSMSCWKQAQSAELWTRWEARHEELL